MALFGGPSTPVSRLKELKRLLQKDPTSRQFLALAEEYRRHGKYRDAVITLERGLQVHSTSVAAHVALGRTYRQLDRLEDAIRAFTNALRLDRENLVAIRQLAEVYLATGDKIEAIKKLKLYCGLKAGDRDVNDIIQKLEEEMSAAAAERPRSGVQPVFSDFPEAPKLPPFTAPIASIREQPEPETAPFDVSDARPEAPAKGEPLVSETLGDLYRAQGHLADARETYRTLAETAADEARARALREKAAALPPAERTDHPRLRRLARRFPKRPEATVDHLHGLLSNLVEGTEGIRAAALTDLEGFPVVMAGPSSRDAAMETLVAELSSFLKNVRRTTAETGTGELESLVVAGPNGGVVVSPVNADYSLILRVDPEAALGEIRWEAARTARALRPAVR
jgi:predicted regulator of Ras-like GTPase activity (Roadblock/LC7/MglB family)